MNSNQIIEQICNETSLSVSKLIENRVLNKELAFLKRDDYANGYNEWYEKLYGFKPSAAKYWLLWLFFRV